MWVCLKEPILQDFLDDDPGSVECDARAIVARGVQRRDVVDLDPVDTLKYQHAAGGIVPVDLGDVKVGLLGKVGTKSVGVTSLTAKVQFSAQCGGELLSDLGQVIDLAQWGACLDQAGQVE